MKIMRFFVNHRNVKIKIVKFYEINTNDKEARH